MITHDKYDCVVEMREHPTLKEIRKRIIHPTNGFTRTFMTVHERRKRHLAHA
jgi:hypothetical protein